MWTSAPHNDTLRVKRFFAIFQRRTGFHCNRWHCVGGLDTVEQSAQKATVCLPMSFPSLFALLVAAVAAFLVSAVTTTPGAGVIVGLSAVVFTPIAALIFLCGGRARKPVPQRPLDLLIVIGWTMFAVISILVGEIAARAAAYGFLTHTFAFLMPGRAQVDAVQVGVGPVRQRSPLS